MVKLNAHYNNGWFLLSNDDFEHLLNCLDNQKFLPIPPDDEEPCETQQVIDDFQKQCRDYFVATVQADKEFGVEASPIIEKKIYYADVMFLLSLLPDWAETVPEGLDPTMYGTLTYEGDLSVKEIVDNIKRRVRGGWKYL